MANNNRSFDVPTPGALTEQSGASFARLVDLMQRLLAPDGCPWDREQDERSLRPYVLEEAAEVVDAIDEGDDQGLCEELGDLSLQVAFLAELARSRGAFGPDDVFARICEKLVRRHPHVFAATQVVDSDEVVANWETIKAAEKPGRRKGVLGRAPRNLSALARARILSERASRVGFDWADARGAREKVAEEWAELDAATAQRDVNAQREEFGDMLFAMVNWARHLAIDPEVALREAADKFVARFAHVESQVEQAGGWPVDDRGKPTRGIDLPTLEEYWQQAKSQKRQP